MVTKFYLSGLMSIKDTPVKSESVTPPMVNKSIQTCLSEHKKVKFRSVLIRKHDNKSNNEEAKSESIEDLTILIKDIINNKSRPANQNQDAQGLDLPWGKHDRWGVQTNPLAPLDILKGEERPSVRWSNPPTY